jgi:hypothetical protein
VVIASNLKRRAARRALQKGTVYPRDVPRLSHLMLTFSLHSHPRPGGGMAYAEDLKSSVPHGICGFDPHPGHTRIDRFYRNIQPKGATFKNKSS